MAEKLAKNSQKYAFFTHFSPFLAIFRKKLVFLLPIFGKKNWQFAGNWQKKLAANRNFCKNSPTRTWFLQFSARKNWQLPIFKIKTGSKFGKPGTGVHVNYLLIFTQKFVKRRIFIAGSMG